MDREGSRFAFLPEKLPRIIKENLKAGIFDGPQIRELIEDPVFDEALSEAELFRLSIIEINSYKLLGKPPECGIREGNWRATEEFSPTWDTSVRETALSTVTLGLFPKELWTFAQRAGWALSLSHLHYERTLLRPVGCELSRWLLLVVEMGCGGCQVQEEVFKKTFHQWIASFVYFSVYYGKIWAFCEYISPEFSIICLIQQENRVIILFYIFQVRACILKIWSD